MLLSAFFVQKLECCRNHNEERSAWPSVVSDDLVQSVDQKICERRRFTTSELFVTFHRLLALFSWDYQS
jgi:hypothetical protein